MKLVSSRGESYKGNVGSRGEAKFGACQNLYDALLTGHPIIDGNISTSFETGNMKPRIVKNAVVVDYQKRRKPTKHYVSTVIFIRLHV